MNLRSFCRLHLPRALCALLLVAAIGASADAQEQDGFGAPSTKLPQDTGVNGLRQALRRLQTTARLMETTAHPDDEDGAMLTLESRGHGVTALSFTLTRGEGGQNKTGSNLFDLLGILRTLEVMASDRYYGVEQRFSHVADFGFSKTAEETLQKWNGGEPALADMVRVIREFRPDVIVSRFQGTPRDGHGNHQASGIITREAFRAAADPTKFPEQIREGLKPWQAKKLYVGMFRRTTEPYTVALDTNVQDPLLGTSYAQFALEGLKHQESQGVGNWTVAPGPRFTYYQLVDSVLPVPGEGTHEGDFFDGIDTSLPGLASRFGVGFLRAPMGKIEEAVKQAATAAASAKPETAAVPLMHALQLMDTALPQVQQAGMPPATKATLLAILREKQDQLRAALNLGLGLELTATVKLSREPSVDAPFMVAPGSEFRAQLKAANAGPQAITIRSSTFAAGQIMARARPMRASGGPQAIAAGGQLTSEWFVSVPADAPYTKTYEHRADPERDAIYIVDDPRYLTLPFPPPPFRASITYSVCNAVKPNDCVESVSTVPVKVKYATASDAVEYPLAVGPRVSVLVEPGTQVLRLRPDATAPVQVRVRSNHDYGSGTVAISVPEGWRADPGSEAAPLAEAEHSYRFTVLPGRLSESVYQVSAELSSSGTKYAKGYTVVSRSDLGEFFYYQPAAQKIRAVDLKLPAGLKVGYIMGAGDDIPTVLQQAGVDVHVITPEELAGGDLSQYGTIVVGIRAYDVRDDVRAHNARLLQYVNNGGTLLVQYNANITEFNQGNYAPYPLQLSRERVTVEEAPLDVLAPQDSAFHEPNQITARDFDGWVQERGLYFADKWDAHYEPLLASHDPGEQPLPGGMLRARYGKGTYIYTGYAFFRQLPAGVPGAVRLFVNLISAGHE